MDGKTDTCQILNCVFHDEQSPYKGETSRNRTEVKDALTSWPCSTLPAPDCTKALRTPCQSRRQPNSQGETEESVPPVSRLPSSPTQPLRQTYSYFYFFFLLMSLKKKKNQ